MNLDVGPAFNRAQTIVNALSPSERFRGAVVFDGLLVRAAVVKRRARALFHDHTAGSDVYRARPREGWPAAQANAHASRKVADAVARISRATTRRVDGE